MLIKFGEPIPVGKQPKATVKQGGNVLFTR